MTTRRWDGGRVWFELAGATRVPGGVYVDQNDPPDEYGEVAMLVMPPGWLPDVVKLPDDIGGQVTRVLRERVAPCACGEHETRHLDLDCDVSVCVCTGQYLWYTTPQGAPCELVAET